MQLGAVSPARPNDHRHKNAYHDFLRESRASISFPGGGFDTARFWEIAAAGSLVISKAITLDMRHSLQPWEHDVPLDTLEELSDAIRFVHTVPTTSVLQAGNTCSDTTRQTPARSTSSPGSSPRVGSIEAASRRMRKIGLVGGPMVGAPRIRRDDGPDIRVLQ